MNQQHLFIVDDGLRRLLTAVKMLNGPIPVGVRTPEAGAPRRQVTAAAGGLIAAGQRRYLTIFAESS